MIKKSFYKYEPVKEAIYDYLTDSLIESELVGIWLTEAREPIEFCCIHCNESKIDLSKYEFSGGNFARTSIEKINALAYRGISPWMIQCPVCDSIYEIACGWEEPNNGRMITTLIGIYEIKKNEKLDKIIGVSYQRSKRSESKIISRKIFKYLFQINIYLKNIIIDFKLEGVLGGQNEQGEPEIMLFGDKSELTNMAKILKTSIIKAIQDLTENDMRIMIPRGMKVTDFEIKRKGNKTCLKGTVNNILSADEEEVLINTISLVTSILESKNANDLKKRLLSHEFGVRDLINSKKTKSTN